MAHWLQVRTVLSEDLDLVLSTHITWLRTTCNSCSRGPNTLLWPLGHCSHEHKPIRRHMYMHIYNLKLYKNAKAVCVALVCVYNRIGVWIRKVSFLSWRCPLTEPEAHWLGYAVSRPVSFRDLPVCPSFTPDWYRVLWMETVLMLARQTLCPWSHVPSPHLIYGLKISCFYYLVLLHISYDSKYKLL